MGGRGSKSSFAGRSTSTGTVYRQLVNNLQQNQPQVQSQLPPQQQVQNQVPTQNNTPVAPGGVTALSQMTDDQLANIAKAARTTQLPNHLNDANDITQKFIYAAGLNAKPTVMDQQAFNQFMKDNNIPQSQVIARSVNGASYSVGNTQYKLSPQQVVQMFTTSRLTYSGGKQGGQALGGGTYFAMTGGSNTGYGGTTMSGVLNPATAKPINYLQLANKARAFAASHPKFAAAIGQYDNSYSGGRNNSAIYALAMGYNVITDANGISGHRGAYFNVLDRSAVVIVQ